ncbi:transposase [Bizionia saleffrena]|uniref:transposase n=1 Tax=Bizionia saleffrena TaxID=291189 RepID=UPI001FEA7252|nr:transposase [Bizionia saleffrena]
MPNHVHVIIEIDSLKASGKEVKIKSLSSVVGAFKTSASKHIHLSGFSAFKWQRSFHDAIIRDQKGYRNISNYSPKNPEK